MGIKKAAPEGAAKLGMNEYMGKRNAAREMVRNVSGVRDADLAVAVLVEATRIAITAITPRPVLFHYDILLEIPILGWAIFTLLLFKIFAN